MLREHRVDLLSFLSKLLDDRKYCDLHRSETRLDAQYDALSFLGLDLVVGVEEGDEQESVESERWLDDVRDVLRILHRIEVAEILLRFFHMRGQIIIGPVRDSPELSPSERESVLDVRRGCRIERELVGPMIPEAEILVAQSDRVGQESHAVFLPFRMPFDIGPRLTEEFDLHLLEFPRPEDEIPGSDLIPEGFSHLRDAEGDFLPAGPQNIREIHEDSSGRLGPEVDERRIILEHSLMRFEHEVEFPDVGEIVRLAERAFDPLPSDVFAQILCRSLLSCPILREFGILRGFHIFFDELIGTESLLALFAIHERIAESSDMSGGDPYLGIHEDRGIEEDHIGSLLGEVPYECIFEVFLENGSVRSVIPRIRKSAVDLGTLEYETSSFAELDYIFHLYCHSEED